MAGIYRDIPITYYNKTGVTDFKVVVFTQNEDPSAIDTPFVAWHVLSPQTAAEFVYPAGVEVGATWEEDAVKNYSGPFRTTLGATWHMTMETPESTAILENANEPPNPEDTITVQNVKPASWSGQPFNFGLYKNGNLIITQNDVRVGGQANFQLTDKLYFGVVSNLQVGTTFKSLTITQSHHMVDLKDYTNGLDIILTRNPSSGEFTFEASSS